MGHTADQDGGYDLSALGWLLFQQLCAGWLEQVVGVEPGWWIGSADRHRYVVLESGLPATAAREELPAPTMVATAWSRAASRDRPDSIEGTLAHAWDAARLARRHDPPIRSLLVLTDLPAGHARSSIDRMAGPPPDGEDELVPVHVLGARALGAAVDEHAELRLRHPYVLGVRRGGPLLPEQALRDSTFDLDAARALARVFVPTGPYVRALSVLREHGFCVLTGPPEMGKTAAARAVGLALMSSGWEVHECTRPEQVTERLRPERRQLFVADDAFGSTEYRPESAERWARTLPEILRATDERHWLVWTSRPTPLKAGLRALHRERGAERFPAPAEVHVDAANLDPAEKALILLRHAKAADLDGSALGIVRREGAEIVDHRHFTPERIRRFVRTRLPRLAVAGSGLEEVRAAVHREIENPTEAMAASYLALGESQRAVLVAMLDCPPGVVSERELAGAARRHAPAGLDRAPSDLLDRLADHFLRMPAPTAVSWVHPSWRDLVIAQLAGDLSARGRFLSSCGHHGVLLALSTAGGASGARRLPLLTTDADWDALADHLPEVVREADERSLAELLRALDTALAAAAEHPGDRAELSSLAALCLRLAARTRPADEPVGANLLEAWLHLAERLPDRPLPPWLSATWAHLLPRHPPDPASPSELALYDEWLLLGETLRELCPQELETLGFPGKQARVARELTEAAQPLLSLDPESPRSVYLSRLLIRAGGLLDRHPLNLAHSVDATQRLADIEESRDLRGRHRSASSAADELVGRVLADLEDHVSPPPSA